MKATPRKPKKSAAPRGAKSSAAAKELLDEVFNHAPVGMVVLDADARILNVNPALTAILKRRKARIVGQIAGEGFGCFNSFESGCGKGKLCAQCTLRLAIVTALGKGGLAREVEFDPSIETDEGMAKKSLRATVTPLSAGREDAPRLLVMIRDISELRQRNEDLERLIRAKDMLLRVVTHDLGSPMTGAFSAIETLLDRIEEAPREIVKDILRTTRDSMERQIELLRRLLDYARVQTDTKSVRIAPVALTPILQAATEALGPSARIKQIDLSLEIGAHRMMALADPELLLRVLVNLIGNAIKFTPRGGAIALSARPDGKSIRFLVRDSGVGMDAETVRKALTSGMAGTTSGTEGERGTGLGLPFVVAVLEAHHSALRVESKPGEGSVFSFDLPVAFDGQTSGLR